MMTKSSHFSDDLVMTFFNIYCHIIGFMLLATASAILFIFRSHLRVVVFFGGGGCVCKIWLFKIQYISNLPEIQ